jgi:hypothetical protein
MALAAEPNGTLEMEVDFIQRPIQSGLLVLAITVILFLGVPTIDDQIETVSSAGAHYVGRDRAVAVFGLDRPPSKPL